MTAAATTGPARQPRPTSSTPATQLNPILRIEFSTVLKARTLTIRRRLLLNRPLLFLHARGLALQVAKEVQLRASDPGRPHHVDLVDHGRVQREDPFDALSERHFPHRERRARAAPMHADHHALEHLDAL